MDLQLSKHGRYFGMEPIPKSGFNIWEYRIWCILSYRSLHYRAVGPDLYMLHVYPCLSYTYRFIAGASPCALSVSVAATRHQKAMK